MVKDVGLIK